MDPDLANMFGDMVGNSTASGSGYYTPSDAVGPSPLTFSQAVPAITKAGGDVISGIGSYMQGMEAAGADEYNANLDLMQGQFNVDAIDSEESEELSTQKAMYAKAGVAFSGSAVDVALETATTYEYDKQVANFNAQSKANMDNYEAAMEKQKGEFGLAAGMLQGAGALLPLALLA